MPGSLPNPEEIVDSFHGDRIAVNALKDEAEADKILQWLKQEINQAWDKREKIKPRYESLSKPLILEVVKLLPRTNCRQGGQPTCMVFAILVANTAKGPEDCPIMKDPQKNQPGKVPRPIPP
jgi:ArsR family metal-binding transcriptional regulator